MKHRGSEFGPKSSCKNAVGCRYLAVSKQLCLIAWQYAVIMVPSCSQVWGSWLGYVGQALSLPFPGLALEMAQEVTCHLTQLYWAVPACLSQVNWYLTWLQMGHNCVHTFRILLRSSWQMCIPPLCCIIEQKLTFLYFHNLFSFCHSSFLFIFVLLSG